MQSLAALVLAHVAGLLLVAGCAHAPAKVVNFDDCLITHMAAIVMLDDVSFEEDVLLRKNVIASQTQLLSDDTLDEDELAQRSSILLSQYAKGADKAIAESESINMAPQVLAAEAIFCGQEQAK